MTYSVAGKEVEFLKDIHQTPHGYRLYTLGQLLNPAPAWTPLTFGQDSNAPPPLDPAVPSSTDLSWVPEFSRKYEALRRQILDAATKYISSGVGLSSPEGQAALNSVNNALDRCDSVAYAIKSGDTSRAPLLLQNMGRIIRSWQFSYDEKRGFLNALEDLLLGIPKNLADAVKFAAEEASQAVRLVAGTTVGKVGIGLAVMSVGLLGLYFWRGRRD